jgi:hypothetical protein
MTQSSPADSRLAVVVTSIAAPNGVLRDLAKGCAENRHSFIVVGDISSPPDFHLEDCDYCDIQGQLATGFATAALLPTRHYARKNIGYLLAMQSRAEVIVETDDDNFPRDEFWKLRTRVAVRPERTGGGWVNVYRYFTDARIWPRGLPLDALENPDGNLNLLPRRRTDCPIQQGLADENPDVDAIYRLTLPLPIRFRSGESVALSRGAWCPFNSQNTTWFPSAYPLLYLPSYCSFRMTDIWRSFVAQRICWENEWSVLFHNATVWQERNVHNLMKDFADEVPGYLHNRAIAEKLDGLALVSGEHRLGENLLVCYEALIELGLIDKRELPLLTAWLSDIADFASPRESAQ